VNDETRQRVSTAVLLLPVLMLGTACPSDTGRTVDSGSTSAGAALPIRLLDAGSAAGLEIIQTTGGPAVDYIIDSLGCGAAWLDYDGDGDPDLYLAQGATPDSPRKGPPDRLMRNDGDLDADGVPSFTDITESSGLGDTLWSFGVSVADYDNDGDPDIHLSNWGPNRLYRNNGDGTFSDVALAAGVADDGFAASATWSDIDLDGDLDLYVTRYLDFDFDRYPSRGEPLEGGGAPCVWRGIEVFCGPRNLSASPDILFRNEGDPDGDGIPNFTDVTRESGLEQGEPRFALAAHFFDADNDGDDDLYVANDSVRNSYYINQGDGRFLEQAVLSGVAYNEQGNEQAGMGITSGDLDGNGLLDLAVTNFSHDHDTVYRNDDGETFTDISYNIGLGSPSFTTLGWGLALVDLDQDGAEDLVVAHGHVYPQVDGRDLGTSYRQPNGFYRNVDGKLRDLGEQAGPGAALRKSSRALLAVDLEGDGDQDLLFTNLNDSPDLLINESRTGHWLQVRLRGVRSNRDGIGARINVIAGGKRQTREMRRDASYAASGLPIAHFGLADLPIIDRLEVRWPSGALSALENLPADLLLTLTEDE
jgi:hypothetical protein